MREVSHFLLELKNGSESRGDVVCGIPHSAPENEVGAGSDFDSPLSATPISLDPLQSASPDTKVGFIRVAEKNSSFLRTYDTEYTLVLEFHLPQLCCTPSALVQRDVIQRHLWLSEVSVICVITFDPPS